MISSLLFRFVILLSCRGKADPQQASYTEQELTNHRKKEVVIFVYHRFGNSKYPSTNISLENFEKHLKYLKDQKFEVLNFSDAVDYINDPKIGYHEKVVCITVDDGYKTFIQNGMPLLQKYGFTATVFINSESVGGGTYMDWDELKSIHEDGIEIGNHSHSHAYFLNIPQEQRIVQFKADVEKCQESIKKNLGGAPEIFAYPYGEFDPEMKEALRTMGFRAAAAQNSGVLYHSDYYAIPRFPMAGPYVKLEAFIEKANMKALRVKRKSTESFVLMGENPPKLIVEFDSSSADLTRFNCFISNDCSSKISGNEVTIQAQQTLKNRRTLYTITAPSKKGNQWHWFSHLWIRPEVAE